MAWCWHVPSTTSKGVVEEMKNNGGGDILDKTIVLYTYDDISTSADGPRKEAKESASQELSRTDETLEIHLISWARQQKGSTCKVKKKNSSIRLYFLFPYYVDVYIVGIIGTFIYISETTILINDGSTQLICRPHILSQSMVFYHLQKIEYLVTRDGLLWKPVYA